MKVREDWRFTPTGHGTAFFVPVGMFAAIDETCLLVGDETGSHPEGAPRACLVLSVAGFATLAVPLELEEARRVHQVLGETIERVALGTSWNGPAQ